MPTPGKLSIESLIVAIGEVPENAEDFK